MNSQILGLKIAGVVFGIMSLVQLLRLVTRFEVVIAGHRVPLWANGLALVVLGGLSFWMWKLSGIANP